MKSTAGGGAYEDSSVARPDSREAARGKGGQEGRIIIPDTAKEKPQEAKVIAVGTGTDIPEEKSARAYDAARRHVLARREIPF
jgi:co-chaperonin GroES (HSP10)